MTTPRKGGYRARRDVGPTIYAALVERCAAVGTTITGLCHRIGLHPSVVSRWKRGATPSLAVWLDLDAELAQVEQDYREEEKGAVDA